MNDPSLVPEYYTKTRSPDPRTMGTESEIPTSSPRACLNNEFNDPFVFGFTGSRFSEQPKSPATPIPPEEDIVLAPQDDQEEYGAPKLSFNLGDTHPIFDFTSRSAPAGNHDWSRHAGNERGNSSRSLRDGGFEYIVANSSTKDYAHNRRRTSTTSCTSGSYVHLTPQASSQHSYAQTISSKVAASTKSSRIAPSPGPSTPDHHSNGSSLRSPRSGLLQPPPRVGPSQNWNVRPRVSYLQPIRLYTHLFRIPN